MVIIASLKKIKNKYDPLNLINSFQSHRIGI
jgi:hypothetical protein